MALPGLSLPGLALPQTGSASFPSAAYSNAPKSARKETLAARSEWRFEVAFNRQYHVKVDSGTAEMFGIELAPRQTYTFSGCKGAILTWQGCELEVSGDAESEYAGQETEYATEWVNVHGMLETFREQNPKNGGPRVLVVGPDAVGKSSLVRSLAAWAVRSGRSPVVVNLDTREGLLAPPSSLTAVVVDSHMDVETSYGISPVSGPTASPVRTPLIYQYPYASPTEKPDAYKDVITRMALSVMNRFEADQAVKGSGLILDSPGSLNDPKNNYELISHIISEFSINVVLAIGSERLSSDLARRFPNRPGDEPIQILRLSKPGGAIERDLSFMKQMRTQQMRQYFFGFSKEPLNPHSHLLNFADIDIYRAQSESAMVVDDSFNPGDNDDEYDVPSSIGVSSTHSILEKVTPSMAMTGSLVAIKFCYGNSEEADIRNSAVMGFLYVAEVDETRKRVRFLAPHPQRWGDRALVWGHGWPEVVPDLVA